MEIAGDTQNTQYMLAHGALNVKLILNDGEYYRLFTSMFMHAGFSHIFNNMLVLFFIGDNLERAVGHIRYFIMYIAGGLLANIAALIYYNIAESLPSTLDCNIANDELEKTFAVGNIHMIMMDKNMDSKQKQQMLNDIDKVEGVKWSLGMNSLIGPTVPESVIPHDTK